MHAVGGAYCACASRTIGHRLGQAAAVGFTLLLLLLLLLPLSAQAAGVSVGTEGIVLSWHTISLTEGSTTAAEVMVRLGTQPTGTVTVALSGNTNTNATSANCSGSGLKLCIDSDGVGSTKTNTSLSFTNSTWETPQTILVSGLNDSDKLNESITLTLTPSGGGYGSTEAATIAVTIRDDDKNQFVFTGLTDSNRAIEVDEGTATSSFTVALSANPASNVTVAITSSNSAVSVSPTSLSFTSTTGTTAQTVTITAGSDPNTEDEEYYLRLVPSGSTDTRTRGYSIAVTVDDNDTTNDLTVSGTSLSLNESSAGNTDTFTVKLASAPAAGKDVTVAIGVHGANGKRIATADKNKLTFTSSTYSTAQTVTITGVVDKDAADETGNVIVTASQDGPFAGLSRTIPITVTDNSKDDGIIVTRNGAAVSSITAGPGTVYANVRLPFQPSGDVSVAVFGATPVTAQFAGSGTTTTFTSRNWDQSQGLTITIGTGAVSPSGIGLTLVATGGAYSQTIVTVYGTSPPTAAISADDSNVTVTFSKTVGTCSTKTDTNAAESVCSGTVTAFTSTTVDDLFELTVDKFAPSYEAPDGVGPGSPVTFNATISGNVVTINPSGITQIGTDIPLTGNVDAIKVLVKDRYWSVGGGILGGSELERVAVPGAGQATARINHRSCCGQYIEVRIDSAKAKGTAGNDWTIVPIRANSSSEGRQITVDNANKQLRIRLGWFPTNRAGMVAAINAISGFTVTGSSGNYVWNWHTHHSVNAYPNVKFSGGYDAGDSTGLRTTNSAPTVANAIANQTVALKERIDLPLAGVFADADGDTLIYSASSSDTSVATTYLFGNSTLRLSGKALGTATITVTATDGRWIDGLAPRSRTSVTDTFTVTVSDAPVSGNAPPPPDNNDPNDPPYEPPVLIGLVLVGNSDPDFDGQTLEVQHVTADSTACLDVQWGSATNGQDVQTWDCNNTNAQQWTFEKRTAGDYAGSYRLVSQVGNGTYCLDNRGDFTTSSRMGIWSCVGDTHGAAANQSVTVAASGDGYTLTFSNGSSSVWLTTDRASDDPEGSAGQTTVSGSAGADAIWQISATKVSWVPPSVVLTWAPPSVSYSNAPASPDAPITQSGTHGPDDLAGAGGNDVLSGGRGDDVLRGLGGDDALYGDSGDDELLGGDGDDELDGGSGDDTYTGGAGADRFVFSPDGPGDKIITDFDASEGDVIVLSAAPSGRPWPSVADIVSSVVAQGSQYYVYTLHDGLTVETDTPLRAADFVE